MRLVKEQFFLMQVSHEKMHTRDRPFECRECGQTFSQKRHLSTHLKFHSGERPFSCQVNFYC